MEHARIAELLRPFLSADPVSVGSEVERHSSTARPGFLSATQLHDISAYIDLLLRWNSRINLTAVRQPEQIVTRHFGESLFAARHLLPRPRDAARDHEFVPLSEEQRRETPSSAITNPHLPTVIDIGAGAGFPGLPLKIWAPEIRLTLIESNHKKATFLREVTRCLTLTDVNVFSGRAEEFATADFPRHHPSADVVTLRAVERFESTLPVAASLVSPGGRLALLIGQARVPQAMKLSPIFHWHSPSLIPRSKERVLLVGSNREPR